MKGICGIGKSPLSPFNTFPPCRLPHTSEGQTDRQLVTCCASHNSPLSAPHQQFPTFSGARHSSEYSWAPTPRLPGPGGHWSTVGGSGYPADSELARSAPQGSGAAAVPSSPPRQGPDWAGTHPAGRGHIGRPRQRGLPLGDPGQEPREPAEARPESRGPAAGREIEPAGDTGRARPARATEKAERASGESGSARGSAYPAPRGPSTIAAAASHKGPGPPCPARRGGGAAGRGQTLHPPSLSLIHI